MTLSLGSCGGDSTSNGTIITTASGRGSNNGELYVLDFAAGGIHQIIDAP